MEEILVEHGTHFCYEEEEILSAISGMKEEYNKNSKRFRGQLGEREMVCYTKEITV